MRRATILLATFAFVPLASATAQEQLASITRDVPTTTFAAANSALVFHPGQWGQGSPRWGCRRGNPCLKGAAIGFFIGASAGAVIGLASGDDGFTVFQKAAIFGAGLGVLGALIGHAIANSGEHNRFRVSVGPQRDARFGLGLSGRF